MNNHEYHEPINQFLGFYSYSSILIIILKKVVINKSGQRIPGPFVGLISLGAGSQFPRDQGRTWSRNLFGDLEKRVRKWAEFIARASAQAFYQGTPTRKIICKLRLKHLRYESLDSHMDSYIKDMFIFSYPSVISSLVVHVDREGLVPNFIIFDRLSRPDAFQIAECA